MEITLRESVDIEGYLLDLLNEQSEEKSADMPFDYTETRFSFGLYIDEELVGGLTAKEKLGEFCISLLAISKDYRNQGLGKRLMKVAEEKALERGCNHLLLTTYSYQGAYFYPKLGFSQLGKISDYPMSGVDKLYFIKYL